MSKFEGCNFASTYASYKFPQEIPKVLCGDKNIQRYKELLTFDNYYDIILCKKNEYQYGDNIMFVRSVVVKSGNKTYRYWKLVENIRTERGTRQKVIAHLGDLSRFTPEDWQNLADRMKSPEIAKRLRSRVLEGPRKGRPSNISNLEFLEGETLAATPKATVLLNTIKIRETKDFGDVYVGLIMWKKLGLGKLMEELIGKENTKIKASVLASLIGVNRMVAPSSELKMVRWFKRTALPNLLGIPEDSINEDKLYRVLKYVACHKEKIEEHIKRDGKDLFDIEYKFLLYDITSTYFEGRMKKVKKAKRGYSRDKRPDCLQVCIGVVIDKVGYPVGYEVLPGNTSDQTTVIPMIEKLEKKFGIANKDRLICMDRGMVNPKNIQEIREKKYLYVIADRRKEVYKWWKKVKEKKWKTIKATEDGEIPLVEVAIAGEEEGDKIILVRSKGCKEKEQSIHERVLSRLTDGLNRLSLRIEKGKLKDRDKIERAIGSVINKHPGINKWVEINFDEKNKKLNWEIKKDIEELAKEVEGVYTLRTNADIGAGEIFNYYKQLTEVESMFRVLKNDLNIRPIYHHNEDRVEAHILFSFLGYVMRWVLEHIHRTNGGRFTGRRLLEYLHEIKIGTIEFVTEGWTRMRIERIVEPTNEQREILHTLDIKLPKINEKLEAIQLNL